jgi:hypothetical protein
MVDKLINDYAKQANLPQEIQTIAQRYTQVKKPDKAQKLYQYVVDTWPKTDSAMNAQLGMFKIPLCQAVREFFIGLIFFEIADRMLLLYLYLFKKLNYFDSHFSAMYSRFLTCWRVFCQMLCRA